jgi:predicted acylesterase/phospholipase RssA
VTAARRALPALALVACLAAGCGAVVGGLVDRANDFVMYPFREWLFLGAYDHANDWEGRWHTLPTTHDLGDVTLGIAISGGGSRSAYFAACVLDELGRKKIPGTKKTYLDEVDFVSAVSGGSLAASYWCANRHREGFPAGHDEFFERMRADMSKDFELRALARFGLGSWALVEFTGYDSWNIFASIWDANFFGGITFGDLDPAGPILIVNATCYETGQKFVFSRLPLSARELPRLDEILGDTHSVTWTGESRLGATMSFESLDQSIAPCPLSTAVAASAAVPGVLGPVVLRGKGDRDLHLGDGGVYDNHGFEALLQAMLPAVKAHPEKLAIILIIDGAGFFASGASAGKLKTTGQYMDRVTAIAWLRNAGFEQVAYAFAQREALRSGPDYPFRRVVVETVSLYDDMGLAIAVPDPVVRQQILTELRGVGTRFSIDEDARSAIAHASPPLTEAAVARLESSVTTRRKLLEELDAPARRDRD